MVTCPKIIIFCATLLFIVPQALAAPLIVDSNSAAAFHDIPDYWIDQAQTDLHIAYQHTSHGSQLITGMNALETFPDFGTKYEWSDTGTAGTLDLDDYGIPGCADLSQGDTIDENGVTPWVTATRTLLDNAANNHVNVIIWSWCSINTHNIQRYLDNMEILVAEYSEGGTAPRAALYPVKFIFMTGHAEGQGEGGFIYTANQQIRQHCIDNDRILFDFADIESYDPDGVYYYDRPMWDDLDYNPGRINNWGIEWCAANPGSELEQLTTGNGVTGYSGCGSCAHSGAGASGETLNCVLKGRACWWMFARLAGWSDCLEIPSGLTAVADSVAQEIALNWSDNSTDPNEDYFIIQRQFNSGSWDNNYDTVIADVNSYTDTSLAIGTYSYRIVAHLDDDGTGSPCDSASSNIATDSIISTTPPDSPTALGAVADSQNLTIALTWTDNSDNEAGFIIQRSFNSGAWNDSYDTVPADAESYDDISLAPGDYTYRIVAYNAYGDSSASNQAGGTILDIPSAPTGLGAAGDSVAGTVTLTWTDNSDNETGFTVQRQTDSGPWDDSYDTAAADSVSYLDNNKASPPLPNATYNYRIAAYNADGNSLPSNESSAVISLSVPDAPSGLGSVLNGFDITLTWTDNSDNEENFVLERKIDSGAFAVLDDTIVPDTETYLDSTLTPLHTYTYRIKAANNFGDSTWSNETSEYIAQDSYTITLKQSVNSYTGCRDAYLESANPTYNYGGDQYNYVRNSPKINFMVAFELPAEILDKKILDAKIVFYCWTISGWQEGQYLDLYRITEDWQEGTADGAFQQDSASWNISCCSTNWTTPGGTFDAELLCCSLIPTSAYYPEFDITDLVQAWADATTPNYGVILKNDSATTTGIKASEYSEYGRPYLEITYTNKSCPNFDALATVDFGDFSVLSENWRFSFPSVPGDIDGDDLVDPNDLAIMADYWLTDCP